MLRYRVKSRPPKYPYDGWKPREAFVILRLDGADARAKYEVEGDPEFVETIKDVLHNSCGLDGHFLQEETTARDLHSAMFDARMRPYAAELIEGKEIFEQSGE